MQAFSKVNDLIGFALDCLNFDRTAAGTDAPPNADGYVIRRYISDFAVMFDLHPIFIRYFKYFDTDTLLDVSDLVVGYFRR